jgi:hypothetical protein
VHGNFEKKVLKAKKKKEAPQKKNILRGMYAETSERDHNTAHGTECPATRDIGEDDSKKESSKDAD